MSPVIASKQMFQSREPPATYIDHKNRRKRLESSIPEEDSKSAVIIHDVINNGKGSKAASVPSNVNKTKVITDRLIDNEECKER